MVGLPVLAGQLPMTLSTIAAIAPLAVYLVYVAIAEAFRLGVAYAHHCMERFEEQPVDIQGLRNVRHTPTPTR